LRRLIDRDSIDELLASLAHKKKALELSEESAGESGQS
jgi:hypothetical protein